MKTSERGEVATILAISAIVVIGISMISSAFLGGKKQSTSSKADGSCTFMPGEQCSDYPAGLCGEGKTCSDLSNGAQCCPVVAINSPTPPQTTTVPTTATASTDPCGGNNGACKDNCGSGNDCVKYLESVSVPGLSDGSVITTDSFSCDIVTKNVSGVRTDTDNICGVKVNDQWPAWCPWDGVGQYMCGATITSRANCDLKSSHFSSTPVKAGDKLQVVAARKTGSCGNIPWNTGGSFITGPTFYYKQKGGGSTNTTPQATTAPQTPRATTAPQPQPTTTSQATTTTTPTGTAGGCQDFGNYCVSECSQVHAGWSCMGEKNNYCCPNVNSITPTITTSSPTSGPTTSQTPTSSLTPTSTSPTIITPISPTSSLPVGGGTLGKTVCIEGEERISCADVPISLFSKVVNCNWLGWKGTYEYAPICQEHWNYACKYQCLGKSAKWEDCSGGDASLATSSKFCNTSAGMPLRISLSIDNLSSMTKYGYTIPRVIVNLCKGTSCHGNRLKNPEVGSSRYNESVDFEVFPSETYTYISASLTDSNNNIYDDSQRIVVSGLLPFPKEYRLKISLK